jgi:hypothetical protein
MWLFWIVFGAVILVGTQLCVREFGMTLKSYLIYTICVVGGTGWNLHEVPFQYGICASVPHAALYCVSALAYVSH